MQGLHRGEERPWGLRRQNAVSQRQLAEARGAREEGEEGRLGDGTPGEEDRLPADTPTELLCGRRCSKGLTIFT